MISRWRAHIYVSERLGWVHSAHLRLGKSGTSIWLLRIAILSREKRRANIYECKYYNVYPVEIHWLTYLVRPWEMDRTWILLLECMQSSYVAVGHEETVSHCVSPALSSESRQIWWGNGHSTGQLVMSTTNANVVVKDRTDLLMLRRHFDRFAWNSDSRLSEINVIRNDWFECWQAVYTGEYCLHWCVAS